VGFALLLIVVGFLVYRATTPEEHERMREAAGRGLLRLWRRLLSSAPEADAFADNLRSRCRLPVLTLSLVALHIVVFAGLLFGRGALGDPATLVRWGASIGTRTTNAEWWRLLTSLFVQPGFVTLVVNTAALVQVGFALERLVGRWTLLAAYLTAGLLAGLSGVALRPVEVTAGSSATIAGLYGMLLALWGTGMLRRSALAIPLAWLRRLLPLAVTFAAASLFAGSVAPASELTGFMVGSVCGVAVAIGHERAARSRAAFACASTCGLALMWAFTLRGIADVRPEIERVLVVEAQTVSAYDDVLGRFKKGRARMPDLIAAIDQTIVPDLKAEQERVEGLERVPSEHQPLVADALIYLRLRVEGWQLRADGLRKISSLMSRRVADTRGRVQERYTADMLTLGKAETRERQALAALERVKGSSSPH
jgi:membrane associated rhomboid family serine protease